MIGGVYAATALASAKDDLRAPATDDRHTLASVGDWPSADVVVGHDLVSSGADTCGCAVEALAFTR